MKDNYVVLENDYIELLIPEDLIEFGKKVLEYTYMKIEEYLDFFHENSYGKKIVGAYLTNREDFLKRIEKVRYPDETEMPPSWASGCFYGGEMQILVDKEKLDDAFYTLPHEAFHLMFNKFVYEKNKQDRILWLDEALAGNFDGTTQLIIDNGNFEKLVNKYYQLELPTMEKFDFSDGLFKTKEYNGYDFFKIIGRYLLEKYNKEELLNYINNFDRIKNDSITILKDSIEYFYAKYN